MERDEGIPCEDSAASDEVEPGPALPGARRQRVRRALPGLAFCGLIVIAIFVILTLRWFVYPETTDPGPVDAVVVLGGGRGERLERGLKLMADGKASVIVLSTGIHWTGPGSQQVKDLCATPVAQFEVICVAALPDSTKGEAIVISKLAAERGWASIALVTTKSHLSRGTRWFRRCSSIRVYPVVAAADSTFREVEHEWLGTVAQFTIDRSCG